MHIDGLIIGELKLAPQTSDTAFRIGLETSG